MTLLAGLQPAMPTLRSGIDSSLPQAGWSADCRSPFIHRQPRRQCPYGRAAIAMHVLLFQSAHRRGVRARRRWLTVAASAPEARPFEIVRPVFLESASCFYEGRSRCGARCSLKRERIARFGSVTSADAPAERVQHKVPLRNVDPSSSKRRIHRLA